MTPSVLVLRALGLGDLLTAIPALRALQGWQPGHDLVLATTPSLGELVSLAVPGVRVLHTDGLAPLAWDGPPPQVAVNLHGRGPESHRVLKTLDPGRLVAYACPGEFRGGPDWDEEEHEVDRWCRLVEDAGAGADPGDLRLTPPVAAPLARGAVLVHPGAGQPARRWPEQRFAAVARALARQGERVLVTGGFLERPSARAVADGAGLPLSSVVAGRTSVTDLAALVAVARLVVCGDTGMAHLATALGTPSVLLFGPTPPALWGPRSGPHTVLWHGSSREDPHADETNSALLDITVDEVVEAASTWLRARVPADQPTG